MIETLLGYNFSNKKLLEDALTHTSYSFHTEFELLEFLGDRVLGLIVADLLLKQKFHTEVKTLARHFTHLVNQECLFKVAKKINLRKYLKHSIKNLSDKVLVDAMEALIGAIFLDSNFETIHKIVENLWLEFIQETKTVMEPKMALQEYAQSLQCALPVYSTIKSSGLQHELSFTMKVEVKKLGEGIGQGPTKQVASKNAAMDLLEKLKKGQCKN
jgi:ribonuclease-3